MCHFRVLTTGGVEHRFWWPTLRNMTEQTQNRSSTAPITDLVRRGPNRYSDPHRLVRLMVEEQHARVNEARQRQSNRVPRFIPTTTWPTSAA